MLGFFSRSARAVILAVAFAMIAPSVSFAAPTKSACQYWLPVLEKNRDDLWQKYQEVSVPFLQFARADIAFVKAQYHCGILHKKTFCDEILIRLATVVIFTRINYKNGDATWLELTQAENENKTYTAWCTNGASAPKR